MTFGSKNSKTGDMPQIFILRSDLHPTEALKNGEDVSVCGTCIHRPKQLGENALKKYSRTCYVNTMSFNAVYKKYARGGYSKPGLGAIAKRLEGHRVRLGAYGDPAAVPVSVWDTILAKCQNTGYTHQWKVCNSDYARYCMASCDTPLDVVLATAKGYRTFFVQNVKQFEDMSRNVDGVKQAICPASREMGKVTTCFACQACNGTRAGLKSNVAIMIH